MPIKIKKFDIEDHTENPEIGYMYLGFDGTGTLVQKDEFGNYQPVVKTDGSKEFDRLTVKYLTVGGTRVFGIPEGNYTIAQGTSNTCQGGISTVRGMNSHSSGYLSFASGEYVVSSGVSSYVWGKGSSTTLSVISDGINSFVHQYLINSPTTIGTLSDYSVILGGYDHKIGGSSTNSTIFGGNSHNIGSNTENSTILGGNANDIGSDSINSAILGGNTNEIGSDCENSVIIGGNQNIIPNGSSNIIILGRDSLTTPIEQNTTYVTKLCLDTSGPSISDYPDGLIWYQDNDIKAMIDGNIESLKAPNSSNFVTIIDNQTITGIKTFTSNTNFNGHVYFNQNTHFNSNTLYTNNFSITCDPTILLGRSISIVGGTGGLVNGGVVNIAGGFGGTNPGGGTQGNGGTLNLYAGDGSSSFLGGYGGTLIMSAGRSYGSKNGGNVTINGGRADKGIGGNIFLVPGQTNSVNKGSIGIGTISLNNQYILNVVGKSIISDTIYCSKMSNTAQFVGNWSSTNYWGIGSNGSDNTLKIQTSDSLGAWQGGNVNVDITGKLTASDVISTTSTFFCNKKTNSAQFVGDRQVGGYWGFGNNGYNDSINIQGCSSTGIWNGDDVKLDVVGRIRSNIFTSRLQGDSLIAWGSPTSLSMGDTPEKTVYVVGLNSTYDVYLPPIDQVVNGEYVNDNRIIIIITTSYGVRVRPVTGEKLNGVKNGYQDVDNHRGQIYFGSRGPSVTSWYKFVH